MILSERLLITKIITSVALALLLIVGAWMAATHTETETAAPTASSVTEHVDAHIAPLAADAPVMDQGTAAPALLGVAVCVLGVLCGLLLVVVNRWLLRARRPQPEPGLLPLLRAMMPAPAPPRAAAFTLTELSISRT